MQRLKKTKKGNKMNEIIKLHPSQIELPIQNFSDNQKLLIKNVICKGSTDDELEIFIMTCNRSGLDPFAKQIYSILRGNIRTIQTSVDGFRLIADRTGRYAPGRESTFEMDKNGNLLSATAYIKKQTMDGTWHEVGASAYFIEYNANSPIWRKMPKLMLQKCSECLALRRAFPAQMSGMYGKEEMDQADYEITTPENEKITVQQALELNFLLKGCSPQVQKYYKDTTFVKLNIDIIDDMPLSEFEKHQKILKDRYDIYQLEIAKQLLETDEPIGLEIFD